MNENELKSFFLQFELKQLGSNMSMLMLKRIPFFCEFKNAFLLFFQ